MKGFLRYPGEKLPRPQEQFIRLPWVDERENSKQKTLPK